MCTIKLQGRGGLTPKTNKGPHGNVQLQSTSRQKILWRNILLTVKTMPGNALSTHGIIITTPIRPRALPCPQFTSVMLCCSWGILPYTNTRCK
jgi:hypothetical protein